MLDLQPRYLELVRKILKSHVPEYEVLAFGSRVTGRAKEFSDLDLSIMTNHPLSLEQLSSLREAFSDSDLPIKVDIVDWADIDEGFKKIIRQASERVQEAGKAA